MKPKCSVCGNKLKLVERVINCECNKLLCLEHRYKEMHVCVPLEKTINLVKVISDKLEKI